MILIINIYNDIENVRKSCLACIEFQTTQPKDKLIPYGMSGNPWETIDAHIFMLDNKT